MNSLWLALALVLATPQDSLPAARARILADLAAVRDLLPQQQTGSDEWFAPDKLQHFTLSYGVTAFAFAGAQLAGADGDTRLRLAASVGLFAGIAKEIADTRQGRRFSLKDLLFDGLGIAAALAILRNVR